MQPFHFFHEPPIPYKSRAWRFLQSQGTKPKVAEKAFSPLQSTRKALRQCRAKGLKNLVKLALGELRRTTGSLQAVLLLSETLKPLILKGFSFTFLDLTPI